MKYYYTNQVTPASGTAFDTLFTVEMDEGWIDPEGDSVSFYIYTQRVGATTRKRLNARGLTDVLSHDLYLPAGMLILSIAQNGFARPFFLF